MRTPALPITLLLLSLGTVAATGCGSGEDGAAATTVVERVTVPSDPSGSDADGGGASDTRSDDAAADRGTATSEAADGGSSTAERSDREASSSEADCVEVPDVVGLRDLQLSQDTLQASGFYVMDQEDATGQDRSQLLDRNWVVTRQDPAAGACVPTSTTITTYAKKHGE